MPESWEECGGGGGTCRRIFETKPTDLHSGRIRTFLEADWRTPPTLQNTVGFLQSLSTRILSYSGVHSIIQSQFSTECDLLLPFSIFSILSSLRSSSICLRLLPRLPVNSTLPFILPSIICLRRQFLRDLWPIQLALLLLHVGYPFPPFLYVIFLHFSQDRSNWSSHSDPFCEEKYILRPTGTENAHS